MRLAWWTILVVAALLRIALFSGYGLGDDPNYFHCYHDILRTGQWNPERAYDWRFAFWVPVVGFMRLFGVSEWSFVGFVFCASLVNVILAWALARQEWPERWAPLLAMALLAVFPLDVLSSTLFVIDIPLAMWAFGALWLYRQACLRWRGAPAIAASAGAGLLLCLAYSTKQWGLLVGAVFAVEALRRLRTTWPQSLVCAGTLVLGLAAYHGWQWLRFGDPIRDFHVVRRVAIFVPHSWDIVTDYSRMLLLPTEFGSWFAGWYPHATLGLALLFLARFRETGTWLVYFLVLLACLSAMPSHRENGQWVLLVPHIFRYLCFLSIPLALALAAYARLLIGRRRAVGVVALGVFLVLSIGQAVVLTRPTRDAFGEQRRVNALLMARFPDERFVSDWDFLHRLKNFHLGAGGTQVQGIASEDPAGQARELAAVEDAVVISGGARLPWYGCRRCPLTLERFEPGPQWHLVTTVDGPLSVYRREALQVWRVSAAEGQATILLEQAGPEASARRELLGRLVASAQWATAVAVGQRLLASGIEARAEIARLTGLACERSNRPRCAAELLAEVLAQADLDAAAAREATVALARAALAALDAEGARAVVGSYRARYPAAPGDPFFDEVLSGLAEGKALYHALRYREAERVFVAIRDRQSELPARRRRAQYFLALTLYRLRDLERADAEANDYRARYGEDDAAIELAFRKAEAQRATHPAEARTAFEILAARHPETYWGREARRLAAQIGGD